MSTRKYIRAMLRGEAERKGIKPSKWVNRQFDRLQIKRHGLEKREINKATGTAPRSRWKSRIAIGLINAEERRTRRKKKA